ncbi:MAG TPA: thiamine phosphate synthase [Candidatus Sulfotelmatobacter sp.]|nr:thiamine phosphate synthase [Candidatus Sulfotelmatobacter sp.]
MAESCLLYYITDRTAFPGDELARRRRLLEKISEAARAGVDYIQLREKDLPARELEALARQAAALIAQRRTESRETRTRLLINSRTDVALAVGADGVQLRSEDVSPQEVRSIWKECGAGVPTRAAPRKDPLVAVSCHTPAEVAQAAANAANFAVFAPVCEKKDAPGARPAGLALLKQACQEKIPVLALGGITIANARSCLEAGAAGIAAIRLFQENDVAEVVRRLRAL